MATAAIRAPRPTGSGTAPAKKFSLSDIQSKSEAAPNRYGLHAREGWGKTSFGAQTPKPIFLQTRGETGLDTLIANHQLPETPHFPEIQSWEDLKEAIHILTHEEHPYRTLVIDTVNGAERLCYEHVCQREFGGDWGNAGFTGYMRGYEVAQADWRMFLNDLDELRHAKRMTIFFLIHTKIKTFKNPQGADYDRWSPDMHEKCWGLTLKWLDCVLFGNFETTIKTDKAGDKKGKAAAASFRMLYTQHQAAFDAKNRFGLPEEIDMGNSPAEAWANFSAALKQGRKEEANG